jgi:hypothetical protein
MHTETEQNNETLALCLGQVCVVGTYIRLSVPSSETKYNQKYNRSKTRYKSDSSDFISVTCLQRNQVKVHKTQVTRHTSLALTSEIIFLSGSNPIKCSYQAQDLSPRDVS